MRIRCAKGCKESKEAANKFFEVVASVTIYEDMKIFNESMDGVDLSEISCAYCAGPVEEVERCGTCGEPMDTCPECGVQSCYRCMPDACPSCNHDRDPATKRFPERKI